ncbi:hypothetical protein GCM10008904_28410 [Paraclostridium ghonii]|uniref:Uncharacterized protein n=1 Tax=Paraclostridium ghonii TaxID=29358 RepID=A0ABU0N3D4_9FIRM|nr:hypothetical protein [Paeniclostridium ghonii]MDQ0557672.1 hypothetical protein [Paeniclostridium ghonii]
MDKSFFNWYTQSLGGIIGLIACMCAYLNGDMAVYGNILRNIDSIGLGGLIASYTLLPLCIAIILLGVMESYSNNENLPDINKNIVITTTLIGFIGSKLFFIIPAIFILFKYYSTFICSKKDLNVKVSQVSQAIEAAEFKKINIKNEEANKNLLKTKIDMAIELLIKGADKNFICEITGLTPQELENIEQRIQ